MWTHGVGDDALCGCGVRFSSCPFWTSVLEGAGNVDADHLARARAFDRRFARGRAALPGFQSSMRRGLAGDASAREHLSTLGRLYRSIAAELSAEVVVDSSSSPAYAHVLTAVDGLRVRILHLVRDPRAVVYSWGRRKETAPRSHGEPDDWFPRAQPVTSALTWTAWNLTTEQLARRLELPYLRVRYEDFAAAPRATASRIAAFAGGTVPDGVFLDERTVHLASSHSVWGNPARFENGAVRLEPDDEWRRSPRPRERLTATLLTWPLLGRYGYGTRA